MIVVPRRQIRPPLRPGPRRLPRGVTMSREPKPIRHDKCGKETAYRYADGQVWCETCGAYITVERTPAKASAPRGVRVTQIKL